MLLRGRRSRTARRSVLTGSLEIVTSTLLSGGSVLDTETGEITAADVLLDGDRIARVGPALDGDQQVDCTGNLLIPGLIDCHAHVAFPGPDETPDSARILEAASLLRGLLARGITTVRDGAFADAGFPLAVERGWLEGPDLLLSIRQLSPTGGIGDAWSPRYGALDTFAGPGLPDPVFDGADSARAAVRRMVRAGADWIKVGASGGVRQGSLAHDSLLSDAEWPAIVDEARRLGNRPVMAHAHGARAAEAAARAGARSIEHGIWLDSDAVKAMRERGCWYVPTLSPTQPDPELAERHRESVRLALEAGVPVAAGSDLAPRPHVDLYTELRHLAAAGLGQAGALRAATVQAARLLRLEDDRGWIGPGMRADVVLLRGTSLDLDYLADRVLRVWRRGRPIAPCAVP